MRHAPQFAAGPILVGLGVTILFGVPSGVLENFEYWPAMGVSLVVGGVALLVWGAVAVWMGRRRRRYPSALELEIATVEADIVQAQAEFNTKQYFLRNAKEYSDELRVQQLVADVVSISARLGELKDKRRRLIERTQ